MIEDPICCPPHVDTFLAVTPVKPIGIERPKKTVKQKQELAKELEDVLDLSYPNGFWEQVDLELERYRLTQQREYLLSQKENVEEQRIGR